jgi:hypothetical protein
MPHLCAGSGFERAVMANGAHIEVVEHGIFHWMRGDKLKLLDDQSAVERDDLGLFMEPVKRGFFGVQFSTFKTVVIRGLKRGRIFCPFAANTDRIESDFSVRPFFDIFEMTEKRVSCADTELSFASA